MSNIVIKRKWDFGFEADAAQQPTLEKLITRITSENLPRQRRSRQRFSDVARAGMEAGAIPQPHTRATDDPGDCPKCKHSWARHIARGSRFQCMARDIDASGNFDGCGCNERPRVNPR